MVKYILILALILPIETFCQAQNADTGVLILAHGGSSDWNKMIENAIIPVKKNYPVSIAYGMALPRTMENGIRELESKGVRKIVVVPLFISSYSFIIRQSEYFLGMRDELADPLLIMDHAAEHQMHANHHSAMDGEKADSNNANSIPEKISTDAEIVMVEALNDHDIVAKILSKRINDLSSDPANESVIIVGHGPNPEMDNVKWLAAMESLAEKIRIGQKAIGKEYKNIFSLTVRDDSDEDIYNMAKENLRSLVRQASRNSTVIVVPLLLSKGGVEQGIVKRLEGLTYVWNGKTLLPDDLISEFILSSVRSVE